MYLSIIKKYIEKITINDIETFSKKNNIYLSKKEISYIYEIINNDKYLELLLNNKEDLVFNNYKDKFTKENINKIKELFHKYKNKFIN